MEKPLSKPIIPTRAQKIALYLLSAIMFGIGLFILLLAISKIGS
jgi:hypothetical protein